MRETIRYFFSRDTLGVRDSTLGMIGIGHRGGVCRRSDNNMKGETVTKRNSVLVVKSKIMIRKQCKRYNTYVTKPLAKQIRTSS